MIALSVVVPVYSGENYIKELIAEIENLRVARDIPGAPITLSELIFVNDASVDNSADIIREYSRGKSWIINLQLSRNFGQHPATVAGILHSSGDWVVTLDEDLQHPPKKIPSLLLRAVTVHADVVYGQTDTTIHESLFRDFSSKIYKKFISVITANKNIRNLSSFRLIRGSIARAASSICGHDTYFDVALLWFTDRVETVS